ncbi:hypothetical protein [Corynebacterium mucifaciens]|uniref:Uncharacterized protein n=1 Tax=Corynebacterium mucifaciens TaxID=57171 RepID=A0ABV2P0P2_9CORY|nr:hypothetical protein [Corynebacterium mucifaciens]
MILVINALVSSVLLSAAIGAIVVLRRNTLLALALMMSLVVVTAYSILNVPAVEEIVHNVIPSGSSLIKDILLVASVSIFAVATRALGGRVSWIDVAGWPGLLAVVKGAAWGYARQWCSAGNGLTFDECAARTGVYAASEVLVLLSLLVYSARLLRSMWSEATRKTAAGRAVFALCVGLGSLICWAMVAVWGVWEVFYLGHLSVPQKFLRSTLSIVAVTGLVVGMFTISFARVWQQAHLRCVVGPVSKRLDEIVPVERGHGVPLITRLMDQIGLAISDENGSIERDAEGGEIDAANWLLGRGEPPRAVPISADPEQQAGWLIRVATIMRNETGKDNK